MSIIEKEYFTLAEVVEEFKMPWGDVIYLAENGHLLLSVLVYSVPVLSGRSGDIAVDEVEPDANRRHLLTGLADLSDHDAHLILKNGKCDVSGFKTAPEEYCTIATHSAPITFNKSDLLIKKNEKQALQILIKPKRKSRKGPAFIHSNDYREVEINGSKFLLGARQAMVIRMLHDAALAGSPWQNGKSLLKDAQSMSNRMHDLFKSKGPDWSRLMISDRKGLYRLAIPLEEIKPPRRKKA